MLESEKSSSIDHPMEGGCLGKVLGTLVVVAETKFGQKSANGDRAPPRQAHASVRVGASRITRRAGMSADVAAAGLSCACWLAAGGAGAYLHRFGRPWRKTQHPQPPRTVRLWLRLVSTAIDDPRVLPGLLALNEPNHPASDDVRHGECLVLARKLHPTRVI